MSVLLDTDQTRPRERVHDRLNWIDPLIIVAIGAALRIAFFRGALGSDEIVYITQAKYLLHGQFDHSTYIGAIRYGINAFHALSLWLFGSSRAGADGLFLACSLGEILLTYFFALHLWDRKAAIWAALAVAVLPIDVALAGSLDPDCYLALAIAGSVVVFYFAERKDRWWLYLIAGLLAGWVYWIKEAVIVFGFVFVVLAVRGRRWRSGYLWFATGGLLMLAASLLLFWRVYGDPFYDFHVEQHFVEHSYVSHNSADTSLGTYFVWLFVKIYHVGLLGWLALAGAVFAVRRRAWAGPRRVAGLRAGGTWHRRAAACNTGAADLRAGGRPRGAARRRRHTHDRRRQRDRSVSAGTQPPTRPRHCAGCCGSHRASTKCCFAAQQRAGLSPPSHTEAICQPILQ